MVQTRVPGAEELPALAEVLSHAFAFEVDKYPEFFRIVGRENVRVAVRDGEVVGGAGLIPMGMYFGGRAVPMTGLAAVGVRADVMRRGVATAMMRDVVRELHERGVALSSLYASTAGLYRKVGYEMAGTHHTATLTAREIPFDESAVPLQRASEADADEVKALYGRVAPGYPGFLQRGEYMWPRVMGKRFGSTTPAHGLLVREQGELVGYLFYRKVPGAGRHHVHVTDLVASTPYAVRRIWTALRDLGSMVDDIVIPTSPHDPFHLAYPNPRHPMKLWDAWFLRITHLPAAIEARGFSPGTTATLQLHVTDDVIPEHTGAWTIRIENGRGHAERGGSGEIQITARGLATLYAGFTSPAALVVAGLLDAPPDRLAELAAPFAGPAPWMRDQF